jgi:hypothetical protein
MKLKLKVKRTDIHTILGRRETGKSYLAKKIADKYPRLLIFDTLDDPLYVDIKNHFYDIKELFNFLKKTENEKYFKAVYHFDASLDDPQILAEFDLICMIVFYRTDMTILVEEVQTFSNTSAWGLSKWFRNLIFKGRHSNISIICTTQTPSNLNKKILGQTNYLYCGQLSTKADIDYVEQFTDLDGVEIQNLADRKFIFKSLREKPVIINNDLTI